MASLAKITILGNLGRDPETRWTANGKQNVLFSVAVSDRKPDGTESTDWYAVTAWAKLGETLDKLAQQGALTKGAQVLVIGRFKTRAYTANDGTTRTSLDVTADDVQLVGSRGDRAQPQDAGYEDVPF